MDPNEVLHQYAELWAGAVLHLHTGDCHAQPRRSRVAEIEAALRRQFFGLPEAKRPALLAHMAATARDVHTTEAALDSVVLCMDWSRGRQPRGPVCPCKPRAECVLLLEEIGCRPTQSPEEGATPEELAQCPMQRPGELALRIIAPKGDLKRWWQVTRRQPSCGLVLWHGPAHRPRYVGEASGETVAQMMRQARHVLHRAREGLGEGRGEVVLLTQPLLDRLGAAG